MAFLDDLKRYLERPEPAFEPDVAAHRKHLIHALARLELIGVSEAEVERAHAVFSHRFPQRTKVMSALILGSLGKGEPQQRVTDLLNVAIDRAVGLDTTTGSKSMDLEIDKIVREAEPFARSPWKVQVELDGSFVDQYALAVGAVRRAGPARVVTAIGKLVLDLPQRDAIRWLLAVEVSPSCARW